MDSPKLWLPGTPSVPQSPFPTLSLSPPQLFPESSRQIPTSAAPCANEVLPLPSFQFLNITSSENFSNTVSTALAPCYPCHSLSFCPVSSIFMILISVSASISYVYPFISLLPISGIYFKNNQNNQGDRLNSTAH